MNDLKTLPRKFAILMVLPLLAVTLCGYIEYGSLAAFFLSPPNAMNQVSNAPAVIYYGLTLVIALMFFLMRQGYKGYEFIAFALSSLLFSFMIKQLTPVVDRPLYAYLVPLLLFFACIWAILKYVFLNPPMRQVRLIVFTLSSAAAFSGAFWMQFKLLKIPMDAGLMQAHFMSGIFLFVFLGFGFSMAEFLLLKIEGGAKPRRRYTIDDEDEEENETD